MNSFENRAALDPIAALVEPDSGPGELLKTVLDALSEPLLVFDTAKRIVFANASASCFLIGHDLPVGEMPGELCESLRFFDSETQTPLSGDSLPLARALRGETTERIEYAVRPAHEVAYKWIDCGARPLRDDAGNIRGAVLTFRDNTDQRNRELGLKTADQLRDFIFSGNLAGIIHSTFDGRILDCNDAVVRMLGYSSREELRSVRAPRVYFDPAERERILRQVSSSPELREFEVSLRRRDNSRCWALISIRLLDAPPGRVGGTLVTTVIDITERKLSEETLHYSQAKFAAFMRYLPGVAFIKDLSGKYVFYNEASLPQFNKRPEEIIGKTDEDIWPADQAATYRANDAAVLESGLPIEFVEQATHQGSLHSWLIFKFPIVENGKVALLGGIGIDITERRTLEDQLAQSRKMEALGRLAGGVAHDFNNLLTVISGYGQLALEGVGSAPATRMTAYLQEILNSARRASGLTGQLLAFSRRQTVQPKVFDLCSLLRSIETLLQRMVGERVDLTVRAASESCAIRVDPNQMEQVLMNLVINARDAMPLGGTLEIECSKLLPPVERPGLAPLEILLEVRDNGVGMDKEVKAQMFEPFFTSKGKGRGTGLGLSTVYGVVTQAGGEIEVDSEPGEGTRFRLYFPVTSENVEESATSPNDSAPVGLETILLVEDDASVRGLAETVLKKLGYRVLTADSGASALEIWRERQHSIDVLLTDVMMPQMSGHELARKLRESNPLLKILFMSGYTDDIISGHGVLARETQLLPKPFTAEALGRKLREVLDARS